MTNKQLKELLNQYPDESIVYIHNNNYDFNSKHISLVEVKYIDSDDFSTPDIILN